MKKTFTNTEIKKFAKYSRYVTENWIDEDIDSIASGKGFIEETKTLQNVNAVWGYLFDLNFDLRVDNFITVDMPKAFIEYIEKKIKWVDAHPYELRYA